MRALLFVVMVALAGATQAGALAECEAAAHGPSAMTSCLQLSRRQATDQMLGEFLDVERLPRAREPETTRERALALLKESQREFERYLRAQCQLAIMTAAPGSAGGPAGAACEVDLLRDRAAALLTLKRGADGN